LRKCFLATNFTNDRTAKVLLYREGAKDTKIFKDEVQDFKSFSKWFVFLRALRFFAVKVLFFQCIHEFARIF